MDLSGKRVLILGGYGLVGQAVARRLLAGGARGGSSCSPSSRKRPRRPWPPSPRRPERRHLEAAWGDVFAFADLKDRSAARGLRRARPAGPPDREPAGPALGGRRRAVLPPPAHHRDAPGHHRGRGEHRHRHRLPGHLQDQPPRLAGPEGGGGPPRAPLETLLVTDYVPQLIRHVQVLYQAMVKAGTRAYVKIGTSGTGGMGLNIPYTHSEEKPSRVLLSKSALAGAHTLLLFLMARTPGRAHHQGDQARGGHRLEADRLRRDPAGGPAGAPVRRGPRARRRPWCRAGPSGPSIPPAGRPRAGTWRACSSTPARTGSSRWRSSARSPPASRWSSSLPRRSRTRWCGS